MISHLHTFSYYSFLEGTSSPGELVQAAVAQQMPALGLTDRHRLSGAVEFYDACQQAGVKPILGLTLPIAYPTRAAVKSHGDLVLLAIDLVGWSNLCRLSSALFASGQEAGETLDFALLAEDTRGLLCLTGGRGGYLVGENHARRGSVKGQLLQLADLFPGRLYVQLDQVGHARAQISTLADLGERTGVPVVATSSTYYLRPKQEHFQRVLAAIRQNTSLAELPERAAAPSGAYFRAPDDLLAYFADYPEAVRGVTEIVERCALHLPLGEQHYPGATTVGRQTADQALRQRAEQGAVVRYGSLSPEVRERLDHELAVVEDLGYAPLFLIMADILEYAHRSDIPTGSRGSASSSLVAHCLGITSPDPLRLNLYFERFLNPARKSPPDIDVDLSSSRRDMLIRYVYKRYGTDHVAMVSTINRFRRRSALREVAKAFGLNEGKIKKLLAGLPRRFWGPPKRRMQEKGGPFAALRGAHPDHAPLFDAAEQLLGMPRHHSLHPGGVVISPGPITELVPTQRATKGVMTTQFDLRAVERVGLVKMDLLGIRGLAVLGSVADQLYTQGRSAYSRQVDFIEAIPDEDEKAAQLVQSTQTIGCFQIESPGMRGVLSDIQAQSIDDIMVALALFRPGPMKGGLSDAFVRRHLGQEEVEHLHPALARLLDDTHGVILYQEQVLKIAHELAGLSLVEGDLLRRAMSHFDPGKQMVTLKAKFIRGAEERNDVPTVIGERIWELMAAFAGYGFPKAHAAAYAKVAWRAAYCKANYPAEFMAAVLANWGGYYRQKDYIEEALRIGLSVRPPHVNYSQREFSVSYLQEKPVLFMGLDQVRDLTRNTQKRIMAHRPYRSIDELLVKVNPRRQEIENLIKVGALEGLGSIPEMLGRASKGIWVAGQPTLFDMPVSVPQVEWTGEDKAKAQRDLLGVAFAWNSGEERF